MSFQNLGYSSNSGVEITSFYKSSSPLVFLKILVEDFCSCHFWTSTGTPSVVDGLQMTPYKWHSIGRCYIFLRVYLSNHLFDMKYGWYEISTSESQYQPLKYTMHWVFLGMSEKVIYNNLWLPLSRLSPSRRDVWSRAYTLLEALERLEIFKEEILGNDFWVEVFWMGNEGSFIPLITHGKASFLHSLLSRAFASFFGGDWVTF